MMAEFQVKGLKELSQKLEKLPDNLRKKGVRRSIAAGMKLIQKQAKANAPRKTGALRRAIAVKGIRSRSNKDLIRSGLFVRHGSARTKSAQAKNDDPYYWWFLENGFRAVGRASRKSSKGKGRRIAGKRYLDRAINSRTGRSIVTIRRTLKKEIETYGG